MKKPKLGIVTLSLPREMPEKARSIQSQVIRKLEKHTQIISNRKIALSVKDATECVKNIYDKGAEALLFVVSSWILASQVIFSIKSVDLPVGLWSIPEMLTGGMVGGSIAHGALDEIGIPHRFFFGWPEEQHVIDKIVGWSKAASAMNRLRNKVYGLIGGMSMAMYPAMVDFSQVAKVFGVRIVHADQLSLIEKARNIDDREVINKLSDIRNTYGRIGVPSNIMDRSIRLYLGARQSIEEQDFDFIGIKCQPELIENYTAPCLAISLLNNDGIVTACEADTNGALTMEILHLLSGQQVLFGDLSNFDPEQKLLRIMNCGAMAPGLAEDPKEIELKLQYEYMGAKRGATTVFCCKSGNVTLARLARVNGKYVLLILRGTAIKRLKKEFKEAKEFWPHAFVKIYADPEKFLQACRSNHIHMIYGDYRDNLLEICRLANIKPLIVE